MSVESPGFTGELNGYQNVSYVEQPPGSEQCLAAIISSVSGAELHESQAALYEAGLVEEKGGTGMLWGEASLQVAGTTVTLAPFEIPEKLKTAEDHDAETTLVDEQMAVLDEQFENGKGIALLYKKTGDPANSEYHWILLTGSLEVDGKKGPIHVMDPLRNPDPKVEAPEPGEEMGYVSRQRIAELIRQSTDYENGAVGIFPHAITTDAPSPDTGRKLTVEYAFDQEPEPIEDTSTATQQ